MGLSRHFSSRPTCPSDSHPAGRNLPPRGASHLAASLLDPRFDSDSCGVGFVAQLSGRPSQEILGHALTALSRLAHRGAVAADGKSSDGVGVTTTIPRQWLLRDMGLTLGAGETPRGAVAADGKSSDGVGVTTTIPRQWLLRDMGLTLGADEPLGVAVLFLPDDDAAQRD